MVQRPQFPQSIAFKYIGDEQIVINENAIIKATENYNNNLVIAQSETSGITYHLLRMPFNESNINRIKEIADIMKFIKELNHPHLMFAYSDILVGSYYCIICPYMEGGTLTLFIKNNFELYNSLPMEVESLRSIELLSLEYIRQLFYGLEKLHSNNIFLKNFSTDDILLKKCNDVSYSLKYVLFISNYFHSKVIINREPSKLSSLYTLPPEYSLDNAKGDIYCMGCILYSMVTIGKHPFKESTPNKIMESKSISQIHVPAHELSTLTLELLEGCLQCNPFKRIDMEAINELIHFRSIYDSYSPIANLKYLPNTQNIIFLNSFRKKGLTLETSEYKLKHQKQSLPLELLALQNEHDLLKIKYNQISASLLKCNEYIKNTHKEADNILNAAEYNEVIGSISNP